MAYWKICQEKDQRVIFFDTIRELDDINYLTYYLKYQLAPVIMGVKSAITLNIGKRQGRTISKVKLLRIIEELGLKGIILRDTKNGHIVLAYRKCALENILNETKARELLESLNYPLDSIYAMVSHLRKRYDYCHCPPELGIFLGFPIEDVTDYMCGTSKKCLLCGYWQVYNNVDEAKKIFKKYDAAKAHMLTYLLDELEKIS